MVAMRRSLLALALAVIAVGAACSPTATTTGQPLWETYHLTGWQPLGTYEVDSLTSAQGVASDETASGLILVYADEGSIPTSLYNAGWTHVGDPDARDGEVVFPYQASDPSMGKMFYVKTSNNQFFTYTHPLDPGEEYNNSFATVSPDGQWLVSGEWDTMTRLLVFPTPVLNPSVPAGGGTLATSGQINLSHPVNDVQGCTFLTSTRLLCTSDDSSQTLWPDQKPLLQVDLSAPLAGGSVTGTVSDLGPLPQVSGCSGNGDFEAEGLDYDSVTSILRVMVIPPGLCQVETDVYEYKPAA